MLAEHGRRGAQGECVVRENVEKTMRRWIQETPVVQNTPPGPRGARAKGGAGGAEARSAEHRPGVGMSMLVMIVLGTWSIGCSDGAPSPSGGGTPAGCVPSENADVVGDECGVFVATSGNDGAPGTKGEPVATLGEAIARAGESGRRVYACAETFEESVEVPAGVTYHDQLVLHPVPEIRVERLILLGVRKSFGLNL